MARMCRLVAVVVLAAACGGPAGGDGLDAGGDAPPAGPRLELPPVIALPYVTAGAGASTAEVTVANPGDAEVTGVGGAALAWSLAGDPDFAIVSAPERIEAGGEAVLSLRWAGASAERIAGATLTVDSEVGAREAEVWAVAGDPGLGTADFAPVTGAGGVTIGDSAVVHMPTAPFPDGVAPWTDDRVHLFVPEGYRERDAQDLVLHFHGHSTTIDATVPAHHYREHVYASGADVILIVPQGPVDTASGDFGKLDDPAGTAALLDEVLIVLYRAGRISRPRVGRLTLTSHSGGYAAVAANLGSSLLDVAQVDLYDSLYGYLSTYLDFALSGAWFRSNYTSSGGTDANNLSLADSLTTAGAAPETAPTQRNLRDAPAIIYYTAASHSGSTRDDGAYGEQLRWVAPHTRRGPRAELRTATAAAGVATVSWLAPADDDVTGWRVETSADGTTWTVAAETAATAAQATFPLAGDGTRVRVVPVVDGVAAADAQPSDVYRVDAAAQVLVVDGFDRVIDGSFGGLSHDFAAVVGEAAGAVNTVSNEAIGEDGFDPSGYPVMIWLLGDESTADHTFTAAERAAIDAYLAGGGRIVVSGSEVGYDLSAVTGGPAWLAAAAGAVYASDDAGTNTAHGSGPLAAIGDFAFGGSAAAYLEEYPDTFAAGSGAQVVLAYQGGAAAAVGLPGRGVVVGFPLEVIENPGDLAAVVAGLIDFVAP